MVITPHHDYYPLTPHAQEQVPRFLRKWITPREPPDSNVVKLLAINHPLYWVFFYLNVCFKRVFVCLLLSAAYFQVLTTGALHQVDAGALRTAASAWHDEFAPLPKPLLVVTVGGPTSNYFTVYYLSYLFVLVYCICCFVYILNRFLLKYYLLGYFFVVTFPLPDTLVFLNMLMIILSPELGRKGSFRISGNLLEHVYAGYLVCILDFILLYLQESRMYFSFMQTNHVLH